MTAWLAERLPDGWLEAAAAGDDDRLDRLEAGMDLGSFLEQLGEAGYQTPAWPPDHGGLGVSLEEGAAIEATLTRCQAPRGFDFVGRVLVAPCIKRFGTPEQKLMLADIACSRTHWCQLFSEPGSGSDLAGLSTRAEPDGDVWVVNGQKVWNSWAHRSHYGLLLARIDPRRPKHKGITCFMLDVGAPGVEVRPLRQMTGEAEFNEVFLSDGATGTTHWSRTGS